MVSARSTARSLRALAGEIAGRDLELGQLARRSFESDAWRRLGYATFEQHTRAQYLREEVEAVELLAPAEGSGGDRYG